MILTRQECWIAALFHAGIVGAMSIVLIGAGHGVAPIGLLLVLGAVREWHPPMVAGWTSICILAIASFLPWRILHVAFSAVGLLGLLASWLMFISLSEALPFTVAFSVPFLAALVGRFVHLALAGRRGSREGPAPPEDSLRDRPA